MKDENKRRKFYCILIITFAFIIAIVLIGIGVYFNMITSNNYIMGTAIDKSDSLLKNYSVRYTEKMNETYVFKTNASDTFNQLFSSYFQGENGLREPNPEQRQTVLKSGLILKSRISEMYFRNDKHWKLNIANYNKKERLLWL